MRAKPLASMGTSTTTLLLQPVPCSSTSPTIDGRKIKNPCFSRGFCLKRSEVACQVRGFGHINLGQGILVPLVQYSHPFDIGFCLSKRWNAIVPLNRARSGIVGSQREGLIAAVQLQQVRQVLNAAMNILSR